MISEIQYICKITEKTNFAKYGALLGSDVSKIVGTPLRATCALATRTYLCACFFFWRYLWRSVLLLTHAIV